MNRNRIIGAATIFGICLVVVLVALFVPVETSADLNANMVVFFLMYENTTPEIQQILLLLLFLGYRFW